MNCNECLEALVACLEGLLNPQQCARLQAHLDTCESCRAEHAALARLRRQLTAQGQARGWSRKRPET